MTMLQTDIYLTTVTSVNSVSALNEASSSNPDSAAPTPLDLAEIVAKPQKVDVAQAHFNQLLQSSSLKACFFALVHDIIPMELPYPRTLAWYK